MVHRTLLVSFSPGVSWSRKTPWWTMFNDRLIDLVYTCSISCITAINYKEQSWSMIHSGVSTWRLLPKTSDTCVNGPCFEKHPKSRTPQTPSRLMILDVYMQGWYLNSTCTLILSDDSWFSSDHQISWVTFSHSFNLAPSMSWTFQNLRRSLGSHRLLVESVFSKVQRVEWVEVF